MSLLVSTALGLVVVVFSAPLVSIQDPTPQKVKRGEQLYVTQKCGTCHSVAGKGNKKGPLDGVGLRLSEDELRQWLVDPDTMATKMKSTRKPAMKSYAKLSKEDLDALVAYMDSLNKKS